MPHDRDTVVSPRDSTIAQSRDAARVQLVLLQERSVDAQGD